MNGLFTLLRTESAGVPCLSAVGDIDSAALQPFAEALHDLIFDAPSRARLDLTTVTAFGPNGLAALSAAVELAGPRGVTMLIETSPAVRQALEAAGLS